VQLLLRLPLFSAVPVLLPAVLLFQICISALLPDISHDQLRNPFLLRFLDADTYEEKYKILNEMENDITDRLINDFSVVLI